MQTEELKYFHEHPSGSRTHEIETTPLPVLEQVEPFNMKELYDEFFVNQEEFLSKYMDKRFIVKGIVKKVGPDIHNKPSIEISDSVNGQTYALLIFPTDDHYNKVKVGGIVSVRANYLVMCNHYGLVMKHSELVAVEK